MWHCHELETCPGCHHPFAWWQLGWAPTNPCSPELNKKWLFKIHGWTYTCVFKHILKYIYLCCFVNINTSLSKKTIWSSCYTMGAFCCTRIWMHMGERDFWTNLNFWATESFANCCLASASLSIFCTCVSAACNLSKNSTPIVNCNVHLFPIWSQWR